MRNAKVWLVLGPQRFEVNGQANLATSADQPVNQIKPSRCSRDSKSISTSDEYLYIFGVFPSSSGISISNGVAGYVTGICSLASQSINQSINQPINHARCTTHSLLVTYLKLYIEFMAHVFMDIPTLAMPSCTLRVRLQSEPITV
jgi:hypothetical protein